MGTKRDGLCGVVAGKLFEGSGFYAARAQLLDGLGDEDFKKVVLFTVRVVLVVADGVSPVRCIGTLNHIHRDLNPNDFEAERRLWWWKGIALECGTRAREASEELATT